MLRAVQQRHYNSQIPPNGSLPDKTFTIGTRDFTIDYVIRDDGNLWFSLSRDLTVLSSGAGFMFPVPVAPGFVLRTETIRRGAQVRVGALFEARSVTHCIDLTLVIGATSSTCAASGG